jgi:hypothetical protein
MKAVIIIIFTVLFGYVNSTNSQIKTFLYPKKVAMETFGVAYQLGSGFDSETRNILSSALDRNTYRISEDREALVDFDFTIYYSSGDYDFNSDVSLTAEVAFKNMLFNVANMFEYRNDRSENSTEFKVYLRICKYFKGKSIIVDEDNLKPKPSTICNDSDRTKDQQNRKEFQQKWGDFFISNIPRKAEAIITISFNNMDQNMKSFISNSLQGRYKSGFVKGELMAEFKRVISESMKKRTFNIDAKAQGISDSGTSNLISKLASTINSDKGSYDDIEKILTSFQGVVNALNYDQAIEDGVIMSYNSQICSKFNISSNEMEGVLSELMSNYLATQTYIDELNQMIVYSNKPKTERYFTNDILETINSDLETFKRYKRNLRDLYLKCSKIDCDWRPNCCIIPDSPIKRFSRIEHKFEEEKIKLVFESNKGDKSTEKYIISGLPITKAFFYMGDYKLKNQSLSNTNDTVITFLAWNWWNRVSDFINKELWPGGGEDVEGVNVPVKILFYDVYGNDYEYIIGKITYIYHGNLDYSVCKFKDDCY